MSAETFENVNWLVDAIARGLQRRTCPAVISVLARLAEQKRSFPHFVEPDACGLPVTRYFAETIAETMMLEPDLAAALATLDGHFKWQQSSFYSDELLGEGFSQNYGWCQLVGPEGFFPGDDFLLGLLLLGPRRHYKDHFHAAPELYWPLTGPTLWKQGAGDFGTKQAGDIIWHDPNIIHATKTDQSPLLAVWSWTRDTAVGARLVG